MVVVVTGASSGIGLESSVKLASMGARVVMVARDQARGERAVADVKSRARSDDVSLLLCDLSSMAAVVSLAHDIQSHCPRLDVLVNNAGSVRNARQVTGDGIEWTFAANYLGHFLLTNLLLDLLKRSVPARVVNVSSEAHRHATMDFDNLQFEKGGYSLLRAYGRSKLAQVLFTFELARRLQGTGVTVNALHPGGVATGIWSAEKFPWYLRIPIALAKRTVLITASHGADRVVYLAASPDVTGKSGGYYDRNRPARTSARAQDRALAQQLWDESVRLTGAGGAPLLTSDP